MACYPHCHKQILTTAAVVPNKTPSLLAQPAPFTGSPSPARPIAPCLLQDQTLTRAQAFTLCAPQPRLCPNSLGRCIVSAIMRLARYELLCIQDPLLRPCFRSAHACYPQKRVARRQRASQHRPLSFGAAGLNRGDILFIVPGGRLVVADAKIMHAAAATHIRNLHSDTITGATAASGERRKRRDR